MSHTQENHCSIYTIFLIKKYIIACNDLFDNCNQLYYVTNNIIPVLSISFYSQKADTISSLAGPELDRVTNPKAQTCK